MEISSTFPNPSYLQQICSILLPNLFCGNPWTKDQRNTQFEKWIVTHNPEKIAKDITAWTEWLTGEFMTTEGVFKKLGVIGFCFGRSKVLEVLGQDQDACFGIGLSFFGTRIIDSLIEVTDLPTDPDL